MNSSVMVEMKASKDEIKADLVNLINQLVAIDDRVQLLASNIQESELSLSALSLLDKVKSDTSKRVQDSMLILAKLQSCHI